MLADWLKKPTTKKNKGMPPSQEIIRLTKDVHHLAQGLRVMLWNFAFLTPIFNRLKAAHELKNVVKEMIPPLLAFFSEVMGPDWNAPRMTAGTREIFERLERECRDAWGKHPWP
jgi:hypothetical protein